MQPQKFHVVTMVMFVPSAEGHSGKRSSQPLFPHLLEGFFLSYLLLQSRCLDCPLLQQYPASHLFLLVVKVIGGRRFRSVSNQRLYGSGYSGRLSEYLREQLFLSFRQLLQMIFPLSDIPYPSHPEVGSQRDIEWLRALTALEGDPIWFPVFMLGGSQLPVTPSPKKSDPLFWPLRAPLCTCTHS